MIYMLICFITVAAAATPCCFYAADAIAADAAISLRYTSFSDIFDACC